MGRASALSSGGVWITVFRKGGAMGFRTQAPRGATLLVALLLWLVGVAELAAGAELPLDAGRWALVASGALLMLGCLVRGL